MSILLNDAASEYLALTPLVTSYPLTMACWFNSDTNSPSNQTLLSLGASSTDSNCLRIRDPSESDLIAVSYDGGTDFAASGGTWSTNTWHHACGVFSASNSRTAYLDGSGGSTDTGASSVTMSGLRIGRMHLSSSFYFSGMLADIALWNVALSQADIDALAAGWSPRLVRPDALVHGIDALTHDDVFDYVSGAAISSFNTPSNGTSHPPQIYPRQRMTHASGVGSSAPEIKGSVFRSAIFGEAA